MAKKKRSSSCLIGCGIGCLVLLIVAIALFAGGAVWIRGLMGGFEEAVETREAVEARFGAPGEFVPAPDGAIPPDRVEAFLAVRGATTESRAGIRRFFESIPMTDEEAEELDNQPIFEKMGSVLGITSSAFGLAGDIGDFFAARNAALGEQEMGLGEYSYIYVLAYYNWLDKSPDDGPGDEDDRHGEFDDAYRRVRRDLVAQLENQLASVGGSGGDGSGGGAEVEPSAATADLRAEIEALRQDRYRVPWQDGLPAPIEASLEPFRERLEAAYDPVTNPFELARMNKRNNFSFGTD